MLSALLIWTLVSVASVIGLYAFLAFEERELAAAVPPGSTTATPGTPVASS